MQIRWTGPAVRQLQAISTYLLAFTSENIAEDLTKRILLAPEPLADFPEMGRPGRVEGTRELTVRGTPYLLVYRTRQDSIRILALLHGAQRWPRTL